jgi:hypothetical protein
MKGGFTYGERKFLQDEYRRASYRWLFNDRVSEEVFFDMVTDRWVAIWRARSSDGHWLRHFSDMSSEDILGKKVMQERDEGAKRTLAQYNAYENYLHSKVMT